VRAAPGTDLDTLEQAVLRLLAGLAADGVDPEQLQRQKNRYEARVVNGLETVARRTNALAEANVFFGDPAAATRMLEQMLAVTPQDVEAALRTYVLDRPRIVMSVVPEGAPEQAASGADVALARPLAAAAPLDRAARPAAEPARTFRPPAVWHDTLPSGVHVTGTRYTELPLVSLSLAVPAGHLYDGPATAGLASLNAEMMNEGTAALDTLALTDALDELGATLRVGSDDDEITVSLRTLHRHLPRAAALLQDVVLRPRLGELELLEVGDGKRAPLPRRCLEPVRAALCVGARLLVGDPFDLLRDGFPVPGDTALRTGHAGTCRAAPIRRARGRGRGFCTTPSAFGCRSWPSRGWRS
jgi:zinc protease